MSFFDSREGKLDFLKRHVIAAWFPRCFNPEGSGLVADFDADWQWLGPQPRLLEFSARQGWAACLLSQHVPEQAELLDECIQRANQDLDHTFAQSSPGGWRQWAEPAGQGRIPSSVQLHGIAYLISFQATHERTHPGQGGLERALAAWEWLKSLPASHRFSLLRLPPLPESCADPWGTVDGIGTPLALCDVNHLGDLFEALHLLYQVWPESDLLSTLQQLRGQMLAQIHAPTGTLREFFLPTGEPGPGHLSSVGRSWQLIKRILLAQDIFPLEKWEVSLIQQVVHSLQTSAMDQGGWVFAMPHHPPFFLEGHDLVVRTKSWWVQFEALACLALVGKSPLVCDDLRRTAAVSYLQTGDFIHNRIVDERRGGVFHYSVGSGNNLTTENHKGSAWKDASHETNCLHLLLQLESP